MTFQERAEAVAGYGFTRRQAEFLTTVMLHAGVCLPRQYTKFCGIVFGQNTRDFFATLTACRYATAHACWRRGGTFYHVHHKGLYRAIGEPDNRHRRRSTMPRVAERLMLLDVVLDHVDVTWLATERGKVQFLVEERQVRRDQLPSVTFGGGSLQTVRYFTDKLPLGRGPRFQEVVFVYLATDPSAHEFRRYLSSYRRLFGALRWWTLYLVLPQFLASSQARYEHAVADLFAPPVAPSVADEFRWYCSQRRAIEQPNVPFPEQVRPRYERARRAFSAPRFADAYRRWRHEGNTVDHDLLSPLLREAWQRGDVRVVLDILPHSYLNLARLVSTA